MVLSFVNPRRAARPQRCVLACGLLLALGGACSGTVNGQDGASEREGDAERRPSVDPQNPTSPPAQQVTPPGDDSSIGVQGPPAPSAGLDCSQPNPGSAPLRRLSNFEYHNTLSDLFASVPGILPLIEAASRGLPAETQSLGFHNNAQLLTVQALLAQRYLDAAEGIALQAAQSGAVLPCAPEVGREMDCARAFIAEFGQRVYRRALSAEERAGYEALFEDTLAKYDFTTAVEWVLFTWLQSPHFLYRVERGEAHAERDVARLTRDEMVTRLAYMFWQSAPDPELLERATTAGLETPEGVAELAREMLRDPRADRLFRFFVEWLDLDRLQEFQRDPEVFRDFPSQLPEWLETETRSFVRELLSRPDGSFDELLTAPYTYVNPQLARHYDLPEPAEDDGFARVEAPERSGILTQAMLLAHDKPYRTSIVGRGLKVRTDLLCQNIPSPPDDVPLELDTSGGAVSQRERLEQHRVDPNCAGCHALMDPIGLVFERFDAMGRYRERDEGGEMIATESELIATRGADGPVADVRELGARLAQSQEAQDCYITQTFRFFFGREVESADACSIARMQQAFAESDRSLTALLIAVTQTHAFLYRPRE